MDNTKRLPGRARTHNIHPSWLLYVDEFDPTNPYRSQGAFCRWAGIRPSSLSAAKRKPIRQWYEVQISIWVEEREKLEAENNNNQPPPWSDAPPWANWRAMEGSGFWWWYEQEPHKNYSSWLSYGGKMELVLSVKGSGKGYTKTKEKRPENE